MGEVRWWRVLAVVTVPIWIGPLLLLIVFDDAITDILEWVTEPRNV